MVNDDDDDVQTLDNFYNEFTNDDSWSLITPYLGLYHNKIHLRPKTNPVKMSSLANEMYLKP